MSKLSFKGNTYTLSQLIDLRNLSPLHRDGEVTDLSDGMIEDINNIDVFKEKYIDELISLKEKESLLKRKEKDKRIRLLESKYKDNRITKQELLELIEEKNFENGRKHLDIIYDDFYIVNINKQKPKEISVTDYGRFFLMLDFMSMKNKIEHTNGRVIKEKDLSEHLEFNNVRTFQNYIYKLTKYGLLCKSGSGSKKFIHINPAYAKRRMKIDQTLYDLFKEDLKDFLSEYEIKYFEMFDEGDDVITPSTIELI